MTATVRLHTPEPEPTGGPDPNPEVPKPTAPPIEDERGPQVPVREPGPSGPPERVSRRSPADAPVLSRA